MDSIKLKLSYQRLRKKPLELDEEDGQVLAAQELQLQQAQVGGRRWLRLRGSSGGSRRRWRRRVRIQGLRRLLRRKAKVVRASLGRVVKRLKEGRSHFGDLFAGNYIFMQVSPAPLGCLQEKSFMAGFGETLAPSRYYIPRVA